MSSEDVKLQQLSKRQKRPATGDIFRVRTVDGEYFFGLVVDGDMPIGPMARGSILVIVFAEGSKSGDLEHPDDLFERPLLMPPAIVNQRPWTLGYAEKVGTTTRLPAGNFVFDDFAFGRLVDRHGTQVKATSDEPVGVWGLGNEHTLADKIASAIGD